MVVKNLVTLFDRSATRNSDKTCMRFLSDQTWEAISWRQAKDMVCQVADGLVDLGIEKGDRVSILSRTRYEWTITDFGIKAAGGVTVPIYETTTAEQVGFILNNSQAKIVIIEDETQLQKLESIKDTLTHIKYVVSFNDVSNKNIGEIPIIPFGQLREIGKPFHSKAYNHALESIGHDDMASIVYTSGTTGNPKGVVLTHGNYAWQMDGIKTRIPWAESYFEGLLFLPLSHIIAQVLQLIHLYTGSIQCYAPGLDNLPQYIKEARPFYFGCVPRIFEKVYEKVMDEVNSSSAFKKKIFHWAIGIGTKRTYLKSQNKKIPLLLAIQDAVSQVLVYKKIQAKLGGRIQFYFCGGAPLAHKVNEFFHAVRMPILEAYGMTETSGAISINTLTDFGIGTLGNPIVGTKVRIAPDGEILTKSQTVFQGYYQNPQATQDAIDDDGWLHTGDVGEVTERGHLKILDRKKDLIITSGGKNVAPQNIESLLNLDPYISQSVVHGDRRKFLSALVTLEEEHIQNYAKDHNITYSNIEELINHEQVYQFIKERIEMANKKLAKFETIKKFAILPKPFSVESGELTPTLKIKRKVINERYQNIFDQLYAGGDRL